MVAFSGYLFWPLARPIYKATSTLLSWKANAPPQCHHSPTASVAPELTCENCLIVSLKAARYQWAVNIFTLPQYPWMWTCLFFFFFHPPKDVMRSCKNMLTMKSFNIKTSQPWHSPWSLILSSDFRNKAFDYIEKKSLLLWWNILLKCRYDKSCVVLKSEAALFWQPTPWRDGQLKYCQRGGSDLQSRIPDDWVEASGFISTKVTWGSGNIPPSGRQRSLQASKGLIHLCH